MSLRLRPARSTDAGALGEILWRFQADTDWMPKLNTGAQTIAYCGGMIDKGWVTVALLDDRIVGFLARDGQDILALYTRRDAFGNGAGSTLLDSAKQVSDRLNLWAFQANKGARRFYRRQGFCEVEHTDGTGNEERLPDVRCVWTKEDAK
jgi:GNAT superfamily N-acetyltransferase